MENFVYNDKFYDDLEDLIENLFEYDYKEEIHNLPDDWSIECHRCKLEPVEDISADWITERIDEERLTEDGDELDRIHKILNKYIDFDSINKEMPKVYYPLWREKATITKQDLIDNL